MKEAVATVLPGFGRQYPMIARSFQASSNVTPLIFCRMSKLSAPAKFKTCLTVAKVIYRHTVQWGSKFAQGLEDSLGVANA
jgi:hypothetical protein